MKGIFESLRRTRTAVFGQIANILGTGDIDEETWEDLEAILIQGDVGVETTLALIERLRQRVTGRHLPQRQPSKNSPRGILRTAAGTKPLNLDYPLAVILIVGVNGSGKTTSIAKLTARFKQEGRKVVLAAADTFRAAAMDQLEIWGERVGVPVITGPEGGDPSSVAFDAIQYAQAHKADISHRRYGRSLAHAAQPDGGDGEDPARDRPARGLGAARDVPRPRCEHGPEWIDPGHSSFSTPSKSAASSWRSWIAAPRGAWCSPSDTNCSFRCALSAPERLWKI